MKHNPDILPHHEDIARTYSKDSLARITAERDRALSDLYTEYGAIVTQRLTGWTRPSILEATRRHAANVVANRKKRKSR